MGTLPTTADSKIGRSFSHGRFLNIINGAKILGYFSNYGYMWGLDEIYPPYIGAPGGEPAVLSSGSNPQPSDPKLD
jgi:hypothetical protein